MKKIFNKRNILLFLSFLIPIIMIYLYILFQELITDHNFFLRGENFLVADMKTQYISLYNYIYNFLHGTDSIFYSFHNSLGGNMASTIGYYLASPLNLLYIFATKVNIPLWTSIICTIKIGLCSLFMNIYISHKFGYKYTNLIFSLSYAFMGFTTVYYFNSMWLDVIYMTPLVIMGIDKLIDGNPLMYIITLCLSIIFNFYIAYMLCIFCIIYFFYEIFIRYSIKDFKSYKKIILRFITSSLLAGGLSAFFLIPVIISMRDVFRFPLDKTKLTIDFSNILFDFVYKIITNIYFCSDDKINIIFRNRPIIHICLFCLLLLFLYFFNKKIQKKEKILSLIIILFFLSSFMIPYLQLFWQGFSFPNGYIDRYSYLFCFFLIFMAAKQFYSGEEISIIKAIIFFFIFLIINYIIIHKEYDFINSSDVILCTCFIILYICIYYLKNKLNMTKIFDMSIILFICLELIIYYLGVKVTKQETYYDKADYMTYYEQLCNKLNSLDNNFYRLGEKIRYNSLDSHICNFYSLNTEISTNNKKLYKFIYNSGGISTYLRINYNYNELPILDSILGIKYAVGNKVDSKFYKYYESYNVNNSISIFEDAYIYINPYALSLGYSISDDFYNNYKKNNVARLDYLNNLVKALSGVDEDILTKIPYLDLGDVKKYNIKEGVEYVYIIVNYKLSTNFSSHGELRINNNAILIDDFSTGVIGIKVSEYTNTLFTAIENNKDIYSYDFYYFNEDVFKKIIEKLKKHQLYNIKIDGNKIAAEIDLDKDSLVMLTIPYDKGWHIYIDGKKTKYREVADTFIGINVPKGKHKIYMKFYPRGLIAGMIITFLNIMLTIIYLKIIKKQKLEI